MRKRPRDPSRVQATTNLPTRRDFEWYGRYPSEGQFGLRVLVACTQYLLAMKLLALWFIRRTWHPLLLAIRAGS